MLIGKKTGQSVIAMLLAVFMLVNAVVINGEESMHKAHDVAKGKTLHVELVVNHDSQQNDHAPDCEYHHNCHSHCSLAAPDTTLTADIPSINATWNSSPTALFLSNINRPPVPPPDQLLFI